VFPHERLQVHVLSGNLIFPNYHQTINASTIIPKKLSNMFSSPSSRVRMNRMQRALAEWTDKQRESYDYEILTQVRHERNVRRREDNNSEWDENEIESRTDNSPSSPTTRSEESSQSTQNLTLGSQSNYRARSFHKRQLPDSLPSWKEWDKLKEINRFAIIQRISTVKWCNDNREAIEKLHSSITKTEIFNHQCSGCDKWFKHCMFIKPKNQNKLCHWCGVNSDAENFLKIEKRKAEKKKNEKKEDDFNIHLHIHCNGLRESVCGKFKMDLEYIPNDPSQRSRKRPIELEDSSESKVQGRKRKMTKKARENKILSQK
jgi:hypothetical protein